MGPSELEELLYEGRRHSLRLTLSSGDQLVIHPDEPFVFHALTLVLPAKPRNGRVTGEPRLVSLPNVALAEVVEPRPGAGRRRR